MEFVFVINPVAGDGKKNAQLEKDLEKYKDKVSYKIHKTQNEGEATSFVKKYISENPNQEVTFVACGGDGSVNEVVNGVYGHENASIAIFASGSGNDFVKYYGGKERFLDLEKLFNGSYQLIDSLLVNNGEKDRICINVCHFGFDSVVAETANEVKKKGGKDPYGVGVRKGILHGRRNKMIVKADGEVLNPKGVMLLCTLGNGQYVGGKYKCAPRAVIDDGLIETCLCTPCSILSFANLIGKYEKGLHLDSPKFKKMLTYKRAKVVTMTHDKEFKISVDGEMISGKSFKVEIMPKSIRLLVPQE